MCTVTYIPVENGYYLTSNRDEHPARPQALFPKKYLHGNQSILYPKDPQGKGSWIAASEKYTVCLLNGAFRSHTPHPPYRHSRGLVVLSVFDYSSALDFCNAVNLFKIEPFTLLIIDNQNHTFTELRWDGSHKHIKNINPKQKHIWSSATLYTDEQAKLRAAFFYRFFENRQVDESSILDFHQTQKIKGKEGILIRRNNRVQTVSTTITSYRNHQIAMKYHSYATHHIPAITQS